MRLFQNFSFWNSTLRFKGKSGHLAAFSKSLFQNQPGFGTSSMEAISKCQILKSQPQKNAVL
jgi:hypothetical protein